MAEVYSGAMDKGLEGVVACSTGISSIMDATLCYRGYVIEDLVEHSNFEETSFLLWNDRLPKTSELTEFTGQIGAQMHLDAELVRVLRTLPTKNVHPMAWLRSAVSILSHFDNDAQNDSPEAKKRVALRLLARMGSLVTLFARTRQNKEYLPPVENRSLAWNFLYMLQGKEPNPTHVKIFDTCLVLHADHELNCSAFSARVTASSLSDVYSAITSAIGALKGPLHGGANEQVMLMLQKIGTLEKAQIWVKDALANKSKIMGFGHRVYKNGDPRARILAEISETLTKEAGMPHWYQMSRLIDNTVQAEKGLLPNVDFYSATVYHALGIEIDLYTPIFAVSRISGWIAHIFEQWQNNRIYRPRGEWVGKKGLSWAPLAKR